MKEYHREDEMDEICQCICTVLECFVERDIAAIFLNGEQQSSGLFTLKMKIQRHFASELPQSTILRDIFSYSVD